MWLPTGISGCNLAYFDMQQKHGFFRVKRRGTHLGESRRFEPFGWFEPFWARNWSKRVPRLELVAIDKSLKTHV